MPELNNQLSRKLLTAAAGWLLFFAVSPTTSYAKEWRGITPARSTRGDVERLLGRCSDAKGSCGFKTDDGDVFIVFAEGYPCAGQLSRDTVLLIDVTPRPGLKFSDFGLDESGFKKLLSPEFESRGMQLYEDREAGVGVETIGGAIHRITYMADAEDRHLCPAYYDHVMSAQVTLCGGLPLAPRVVASYGGTAADEKAALDKLAGELENEPGAQAYVVAYAGRRAYDGEALRRAERARNYLMSTHDVGAGRVVIVDGGYREEATVELYVVPAGATPPSLTPTVDPKDVRVLPGSEVKKPM